MGDYGGDYSSTLNSNNPISNALLFSFVRSALFGGIVFPIIPSDAPKTNLR